MGQSAATEEGADKAGNAGGRRSAVSASLRSRSASRAFTSLDQFIKPIVNGSEPRQAASSLSPEPLLSDPCLLGARERPAGEVDHLVSILRI